MDSAKPFDIATDVTLVQMPDPPIFMTANGIYRDGVLLTKPADSEPVTEFPVMRIVSLDPSFVFTGPAAPVKIKWSEYGDFDSLDQDRMLAVLEAVEADEEYRGDWVSAYEAGLKLIGVMIEPANGPDILAVTRDIARGG
jgi:hypothetical protein